MTASRFRPSPGVRASISTDGLVLLDVRGGVVLGSNAIGARIWQLLERHHSPEDIARRFVEDYGLDPEEAGRDVGAFVAALAARRLIRQEESS